MQSNMLYGSDEMYLSQILNVLIAIRNGDFSVKKPTNLTGLEWKIADTLNDVLETKKTFTGSVVKICKAVGKKGKIAKQIDFETSRRDWSLMTEAINELVEDLKDIEIDLLLEGIQRLYGYDFKDYSRPYLKRRIEAMIKNENVESVSGLQEKVLHNPSVIGNFLQGVTSGITEIFRDPAFYLVLRQNIFPALKGLFLCKVWVAGCGTGEDVARLQFCFQKAIV